MKKSVSEVYLQALRDERMLLKEIKENSSDPATTARNILANIELTINQGWSGEMREYMKGSCDFWRNQIKKGLI